MTTAAALEAIARGDAPDALELAQRASQDGDPLADALAAHLGAAASGEVYDDPGAFEAFIDGGGNVELYNRTIEFVRDQHLDRSPATVLEIGCGDGRVLHGALGPATTRIDLVEPSAALLEQAGERLGSGSASVHGHALDIGDFLGTTEASERWDLTQATFSLHTMPPAVRQPVLTELAARSEHLMIVDFDVPAFEDGSVEHARYAADRYQAGIAEYRDVPEVISGFLMPVLVGQFDPAEPRHTHEQPAGAWRAELESAGWRVERQEPISDYWWAPAVGFVAVAG